MPVTLHTPNPSDLTEAEMTSFLGDFRRVPEGEITIDTI